MNVKRIVREYLIKNGNEILFNLKDYNQWATPPNYVKPDYPKILKKHPHLLPNFKVKNDKEFLKFQMIIHYFLIDNAHNRLFNPNNYCSCRINTNEFIKCKNLLNNCVSGVFC
jgi:hypothetical protein